MLPKFDPLILFGSSGVFVVITALILRLVYSSRKHSRQVHEPNLRLFMSHTWGENHQNHQNVMKICRHLRNGSYRIDKVWVDEEQMPPGSNIAEKIMEGVSDSNCFVVFITRDYIQRFLRRDDSDWCVYEMNLAVRHKLIIVPVLFDNSINPNETLPSPFDAFLRDFIAIDLRQSATMLDEEKCNEIINSALTMLADKTIKMMQESVGTGTVSEERIENIVNSGYETLQLCRSQLQELTSFEVKAKLLIQKKFKKEKEALARREKEELGRIQVNVQSKKESWSTKAKKTTTSIRSIKLDRKSELEEEEEEVKQEKNNVYQILHKFLNLEQSQILNPTNEDILYALSDLIPNSSFTLVYRSNRNQPIPAAFHRCVDNIGPTVLLFKVDGIGLFGGYTSSNWHSVNELWDYVKDVNAFLFTLQPRMKFPIKLEKTSRAIFTSPYSVSFGKDLEFTHYGLLTHVRLQFPVNYQDITARGISNFCNPAQANDWLPIQVFEAWAVRPIQW